MVYGCLWYANNELVTGAFAKPTFTYRGRGPHIARNISPLLRPMMLFTLALPNRSEQVDRGKRALPMVI